jgi:tetratricopeptide (TPR) repeat protein
LGYAQIGLGVLLILSGGKARAQMLFQQALALFRRLGNKRGIAIATGYLGHLAVLRGDYEKASKLLTESLASPQDSATTCPSPSCTTSSARSRSAKVTTTPAARLFSQGLDAARRVPDRFPLLISLYDLARSSQAREDLAGAAGFLREGLSVASDAGDESSVGYYLQRLAALARQREDPDRAVRQLAAADALLQAAGTGWLVAYAATAPSGDDTLPGLHSRMGDATFQQAWAQGAAMGRQQAVE